MPSHVEFESNSFDDLLIDQNDTTAVNEPVTAEIPENNTLVNSSQEDNSVQRDQHPSEYTDKDDFLTPFLSEYGIKDRKITYENEDGSTEEVDFNSLDLEEKLSILKEITSPNLTKDEIEVINYLRSSNQTIQDVIDYYSQKAVNDYIEENGPIEKQYTIDDYSDDELYIADLKSKYSDMTDQDLKSDLENAKENTELFKKKIESIRKQYKEKEDAENTKKLREREEQFDNFKSSIENQLAEFNEISMDYKDSKSDTLQIEDSEKEEIYNYILKQDENGATQFFKDLNNPKTLIELA